MVEEEIQQNFIFYILKKRTEMPAPNSKIYRKNFNLLSANPRKWSNTLKQFVGILWS